MNQRPFRHTSAAPNSMTASAAVTRRSTRGAPSRCGDPSRTSAEQNLESARAHSNQAALTRRCECQMILTRSTVRLLAPSGLGRCEQIDLPRLNHCVVQSLQALLVTPCVRETTVLCLRILRLKTLRNELDGGQSNLPLRCDMTRVACRAAARLIRSGRLSFFGYRRRIS